MAGRPPNSFARGRFRAPDSGAPRAPSTGGKSPYRLGRDFERATRGRLERRGFFVMRSSLSKGHKLILPNGEAAHSKLDLLAVKGVQSVSIGGAGPMYEQPTHIVLGIQCKRRGDIGSGEWNELVTVCRAYGMLPVVATKTGERTTAFYRLDDVRIPRKPGRPWTEIDPSTGEPVPVQMQL